VIAPLALSQINPVFIITRSGKDFVLYAGLLDAAHRTGKLQAIHTQVIQFPADANGWTTFVHATVFLDGKRFDGTGDANPANVGKNIAPHAPRMAETRAKARALRDALNINGVAIEELGDEDEGAPPAWARQLVPRVRSVVPAPATMERCERLWALLQREGPPPAPADQAAADALLAELEELAACTLASEEQWQRYVDAAAKLTAAGVPEQEIRAPDSMTVLDYEQVMIRMNALKKRLTAPRKAARA
jgi:hypothetical protein